MKNSIALIIACSFGLMCSAQAFHHKDTLRFAPDSSYSRAIVRQGKFLLFGTSRNGVVKLDEKTGSSVTVIPPSSSSGEFRSVAICGKAIFGIVSGDRGEIWRAGERDTALLTDYGNLFLDDIKACGNYLVVLGDPVYGTFFMEKIGPDGVKSKSLNSPAAVSGEACYAASATTLFVFSGKKIAFVSGGGGKARFHVTENGGEKWLSVDLPMNGSDGCGPFSVFFTGKKRGMIVGGCYTSPNNAQNSSLYTTDGGKSWQVSETVTNGYRSCVTGNRKIQFACGTNGIDFSADGGRNWQTFDSGNFCALLLEGKTLYATTSKGYAIKYALK